MRVICILAHVLVLPALVVVGLSGCGSRESAAPTVAVDGPALIFFYTDP
jgi:hypothetical protein